jgi:hypothetical protein
MIAAPVVLSLYLAFSHVHVEALLGGIDSMPAPSALSAITSSDQLHLRSLALDRRVALLTRIRALRILAGTTNNTHSSVDVDGALAMLLTAPERELRVQAAWATLDRARRSGVALAAAVRLATDPDPAVREVGIIALWRDGSPAARAVVVQRQGEETNATVIRIIHARLARWRGSRGRKATRSRPSARNP